MVDQGRCRERDRNSEYQRKATSSEKAVARTTIDKRGEASGVARRTSASGAGSVAGSEAAPGGRCEGTGGVQIGPPYGTEEGVAPGVAVDVRDARAVGGVGRVGAEIRGERGELGTAALPVETSGMAGDDAGGGTSGVGMARGPSGRNRAEGGTDGSATGAVGPVAGMSVVTGRDTAAGGVVPALSGNSEGAEDIEAGGDPSAVEGTVPDGGVWAAGDSAATREFGIMGGVPVGWGCLPARGRRASRRGASTFKPSGVCFWKVMMSARSSQKLSISSPWLLRNVIFVVFRGARRETKVSVMP